MQTPSRDEMVRYLVEREPPKERHRRGAELRAKGDQEIKREYVEARNEYEQRRASQLEKVNQHILSNAEPDWQDWWGRDPWTAHEATVLSLGKDPHVLTEHRLRVLPPKDYFLLRYDQGRAQIERGIAGGYFAEQIAAAKFAAWAKEKGITLNRALLSLLPRPETDARDELKQAQSKIASLQGQIETLTKQNEKLRSNGLASARTRALNTARLILLGIATQKYGFGRRPAARKIADDVELAGYEVSEDAVFDHLQAALEQHGKADRP